MCIQLLAAASEFRVPPVEGRILVPNHFWQGNHERRLQINTELLEFIRWVPRICRRRCLPVSADSLASLRGARFPPGLAAC